MASLVLGTAGAIVGGIYGGPTGAQIGWAIGSAIGGALDPKKTKQQGPRLNDLKIPGVQYGDPISHIKGRYRTAGQIWWASAKREIATTTSEDAGGKGGGPTVETTTYTYEIDLLIGLTENEIAGVPRVWQNGKLIYNVLSSEAQADLLGVTEDESFIERALASVAASQTTPYWRRFTVYLGTGSQLPDPTYEAAVGSANAIAYRHRSYVFIEGLQLGGPPGQLPNMEFEVITQASAGEIDATVLLQSSFAGNDPSDISSYNSTETETSENPTTTYAPEYENNELIIKANNGQRIAYTNAQMGIQTGDGVCFEYICRLPTVVGGFAFAPWRVSKNVDQNSFVAMHVHHTTRIVSFQIHQSGAVQSTGTTLGATDTHFAIQFDDETDIGADIRFYIAGNLVLTATGTEVFQDSTWSVIFGSLGTAPQTIGERLIFSHLRVKRGVIYTGASFTPPTSFPDPDTSADTLTPLTESVPDVVSDFCVRAGLTTSQIDVTDLASITRPLRGLAVSQVTSTRSVLEMMMSAYFFEAVVSDKIYFRVRASDAVVDIPYEDLGASTGENIEPLALRLNSDIEIPAQFALTYSNLKSDYNTDTQFSDRLITAVDESLESIQLPMVFIPSEAKLIVDAIMGDRAASITETEICLLGEYTAYEPTDVITTYDEDGTQYRLRLVQKEDTFPKLKFKAVVDDATVVESEAITSDDYTPVIDVSEPSDTVIELMDIPIGRDADDDTGFYVAAKGDVPWPGAEIMKSSDDIAYSIVTTVTESAVIGSVSVALGDWAGSRVFDEFNSVTVDVGDGVLTSSTRSAILANKLTNCMLIGDEIIQFVTATLLGTGVYTLTRLLRGCRGTEWAMTGHTTGERCVLLRTTGGVRRVQMDNAELGLTRYYAGRTFGRTLASALAGSPATGESFINNANGKKPFSPVGLRVVRDSSNNITGTFHRRTRLNCRYAGSLGVNVPLGETTEAYEIDVRPVGSPNGVLRTIEVTDEAFSYSAANQTSDGATPGDQFVFQVYQISATVDRGYALEKTA
jgi:hypothetical protein